MWPAAHTPSLPGSCDRRHRSTGRIPASLHSPHPALRCWAPRDSSCWNERHLQSQDVMREVPLLCRPSEVEPSPITPPSYESLPRLGDLYLGLPYFCIPSMHAAQDSPFQSTPAPHFLGPFILSLWLRKLRSPDPRARSPSPVACGTLSPGLLHAVPIQGPLHPWCFSHLTSHRLPYL